QARLPGEKTALAAVPSVPEPGELRVPSWTQALTLGVCSLVALAAGACELARGPGKLGLGQRTLLACSIGLWAATLHTFYLRYLRGRRAHPRPGLPGEGVMLWTMLLAGTVLGTTLTQE